ncbi:LysR family transcriptional regulator [Gloeobacter violaceus]|uniref:LysR family transcriptional regulatory protein n=1 Tax=Gloeobacter violaceus (strain ATCC 29082 / PCC 7421) TaxID=251221 RepID=Q7NLW8_GLOVI|nr:LysR family transcriptional regulator [Gloeobacter violaceus]BAC88942.1 LysR family transcriptional regulatory protein [Gloeobacter violaceus PCC 7421]
MKHATLHQLQVFQVVARHRSFTRAAEELFLTQPTVSMQIKQLTRAVGMPLFEQIGKRLFLTDAGRELLATCEEIFTRLAQFEMTVSDMQGLKKGQLRLAVVTTAKYFAPRLLGPFCQRYPEIDISLEVANRGRVLERLAENLDDFYIVGQVPEDLNVEMHPFLDDQLVVIAPYHHPLALQRNIPASRLVQEPFLMREPGSGTRMVVQQFFEERRLTPRVKMELGSSEAIKQAVIGGLGIAVLSHHALASEGALHHLAILNVEGFPIRRHWHVVYPAGKRLSVVARTFLQYLIEEGREVAERTSFEMTSLLERPA